MRFFKIFSIIFAVTFALTLTLPAFPRDTGPVPKTDITVKEKISDQQAFTTIIPGSEARFPRAVTECGFTTEYDGAVWAGHTEFWLQQQGYHNFYVTSWCGGGDFCDQYCFRVYYDFGNLKENVSEGIVVYKLGSPPKEQESFESIRARAVLSVRR